MAVQGFERERDLVIFFIILTLGSRSRFNDILGGIRRAPFVVYKEGKGEQWTSDSW